MSRSEGLMASISTTFTKALSAALPTARSTARHPVSVAIIARITLCGVGSYIGELDEDILSLVVLQTEG